MAEVPIASRDIVQQQATPNARVTTDAPLTAFGGGTQVVAQATEGLGDQAMQMAKREKDKADDVATTEAYTKTVALRNQLMYDPKSGAMTRKGKDAFGVGEEYGAQFKSGADAIEASLTNDDQKEIYKKIRAHEQQDLDSNLTKHTYTEAQNYDQETTVAAVGAARDDAIQNYQNPGKIAQSLEVQKSLIQAHADRNGLPQEEVDRNLAEVKSKTHEAVINRMLANGQDLAASHYYKDVKEQILGADKIQLDKALEEGTIRGSSQRTSLEIYGAHSSSMVDAMAAVDKIKDSKIQDATRVRIKEKFSEAEESQKLQGEQAFRSAYTAVEKSRNKDDIPVPTWAAMSPAQKNVINDFLKKDGVQTDIKEYYNLHTMASTPELQKKFMTTYLPSYIGKLSNSDLKEVIGLQDALRKGGEKGDKLLNGYRTNREIVEGSLRPMGIAKDDPRVDQIHRAVDQQVVLEKQATGKTDIPTSKIQEITDNVIVKAHEKGATGIFGMFRGDKPALEFDPNTMVEVDIQDIPKTERKSIEATLRARGIPVTDQKIQQLYSTKVNRMRSGQ